MAPVFCLSRPILNRVRGRPLSIAVRETIRGGGNLQRDFFVGRVLLASHKLGVNAVSSEKFSVRPRLHDLSLLQNKNAVCIDHARKAVRNNEGCPAFHEPAQSFLYERLVLGVDTGERLVKHENGRIHEQGASDGDALPLTAGKSRAALTDNSLIAVGQCHNENMRIGGAGGSFNFRLRCLRSGETQIFRHSAVKEIGILGNDRDMAAQETGDRSRRSDRREEYGPFVDRRNGASMTQGSTYRPTWPHDSEFFTLTQRKGNIAQRRTKAVLIAEGNVLEADFRLEKTGRNG